MNEEGDTQLTETINELRDAAKQAEDPKVKKSFYDLVLKALAIKHKADAAGKARKGTGFQV